MNTFEKIQKLHNDLMKFQAKLEKIDSVTDSERTELLRESNMLAAPCGGAYGEYTYLFESCGKKLHEIVNDFYDRIDNTGEYAE